MRKKFFFLPLFAALSLTGCQSDEPGGSGSNEGNNDQKCGYVAVNIVQPIVQPGSTPGSKAASEGFEYGNDDENYAENGTFFIFDNDGRLIQDAQTINLSGTGTGNTPEVERIYSAVLVIEDVKEKPANAKKIVCVLNAPDAIRNITKPAEGQDPITIANLEGRIGDYRGESRAFVMSNSVYMGADNTKVLATTIDDDDIATTPDEAKEFPVDIYVERTVAKIEASANTTTGITDNKANPAINGVTTTLDIKITGIEVANIAPQSYLFKNIGTAGYDFTWTWNDVTNKRSYWETVPESMAFENKSYADITDSTKGGHPISDTKSISFSEYIQPNTSDTKTAILVTAQLMKDNAPFTTLAYIRGGYTTIDEAKNVVATYLAKKGYYKQDPANASHFIQLDKDDLVWKNNQDFKAAGQSIVEDLKDYEVVAQLASGITTVYNQDGQEISTGTTDINNLLKSNDVIPASYRARVFTDGKCYYYVPIDHSTITGEAAGTTTGVVRNHIYRLTLQSIGGIGTPVFDPTDMIIPDKPTGEESFYLAARVNVLAWKLATQTVNFQGNN